MLTLIVDDSRTVRQLLCAALSSLGANEIAQAESAEKAVALLKINPKVDLILTDWHMPGMSGLEFLQKLRAIPRYKETPIIMTTSEAAGENVVAALRAGATNYIIKPFDKKQIAEKVGPYIKAKSAASTSATSLPGVSLSGKLSADELGSVVQYLMQSGKTGRCEVECKNCTAIIYFESGQVSGAQYQLQKGETAFFTLLSVPVSRYRFHEGEQFMPRESAISASSTALLLEAAARRDTQFSAGA